MKTQSMIKLENGLPAKLFRETINTNFDSLLKNLKNNNQVTDDNLTNIDDLQALVLLQGSYIDSLEMDKYYQNKEIKELQGVVDVNETQQIRDSLRLSEVEEILEILTTPKNSKIKKIWNWITYSDGVSTKK